LNAIKLFPALVLILFILGACQKSPEDYKAELTREGVSLTPERLSQAVIAADLPLLERMAQAGMDLNTPLPEGKTAFLLAAEHNQVAVLSFLNTRRISAEAVMPDGRSALHLAAAAGNKEAVQFLLNLKISPNTLDQASRSPLVAAAEKNHLAVFQLLHAAQENASVKNPESISPLAAALENGHEDMALTLLGLGYDYKTASVQGQPFLVWASATNQKKVFSKLLELGADPNAKIKTPASTTFKAKVANENFHYYLTKEKNVTLLMMVAALGQTELVDLLLLNGADKTAQTTHHKTTAIYLASVNHHASIVQVLLGKSAKPEDQRFRIEVSISKQKATLFKDGKKYLNTAISSGRKGFGTPRGTYVVTNKYKDWISTLYHAEMPYFLRLNCGPIGLHAGALPGYPASHGCIRLPYEKAKEIFATVDVGTIVNIID